MKIDQIEKTHKHTYMYYIMKNINKTYILRKSSTVKNILNTHIHYF